MKKICKRNVKAKILLARRDTLNGVSRQFYSPFRRVLLLRSDIRLTPSDIRFASFKANRISLKPQGSNITIALAIISLRRSRNIT